MAPKTYFKKSYKPKSKTSKDVKQDKEITRLKKVVNSLSKTDEPKFLYTSIAESSLVNSTPKSLLLNGCTEGTANTQRVGKSFYVDRIEARCYIHSNTNLNETYPIRILLVQTRQNKGDAFSFTDLFNNSTPADRTLFGYSSKNIPKLYKIWMDKTFYISHHNINYTSTTGKSPGNAPTHITFNFKKKLGFETTYNSSSGAVSDIETNALHFVIITDNATANALECHSQVMVFGRG